MTHTTRLIIGSLGTFLLLACGGSPGAGSASGAAQTFRGPITSFDGGMTVNGIAFRTSGASVILPDEAVGQVKLSGESQVRTVLALGMVVRVTGSSPDDRTGEATEIEFEHALEGEVELQGPGHVDVLGEHVSIDGDTGIVDRHGDPLTSDDLIPGTRVEVSGHADSRGGVLATFLRVRDDRNGEDQEVKAFVVGLSGSIVDLAFAKGGAPALQIDVSGISPAPILAVGDFVEVRTNGTRTAGGALVVLAVRVEDEGQDEPEREVEGIVTEVTGAGATLSGFVVAGQAVSVSGSTRFVGGTPDDLVMGAKVEVEGTVSAGDVLAAEEVKFESFVRIEAKAEAKDEAAGTITMLGLTVHMSPSTEGIAPASVSIGDFVEVRGAMTRDGLGVNASRLEGISPSDRAILRGLVTAKGPSDLTIAGIAIDLTGAKFEGAGMSPLTAEQFLAAVTPGQTIVKVRWRPYPASTAEPVEEAQLQN